MEAAVADALANGQVDEGGGPVLPEIIPPVDPLIPVLVSVVPETRVYALNRVGVQHVLVLEGYVAPLDLVPSVAEWTLDPIREEGVVVKNPLPIYVGPGSSYGKEQSLFLCHLAGAVTASGGVYPNCEQNPGCSKFSHAQVTRSNKNSVAGMLTSMDMFKNNRVLKAKCEEYLATI